MAAGVSDRLWDVADIVALVEAATEPQKKRAVQVEGLEGGQPVD
jgi:hypothetical protein